MSSVRVRTQPEKDGERTGLLVHPLIEITHSFSLQRGWLMFKYQSVINPSFPRRTGALHPYSSLRTQTFSAKTSDSAENTPAFAGCPYSCRLDFCSLDSQNSLVFKHISEKSFFSTFFSEIKFYKLLPEQKKTWNFWTICFTIDTASRLFKYDLRNSVILFIPVEDATDDIIVSALAQELLSGFYWVLAGIIARFVFGQDALHHSASPHSTSSHSAFPPPRSKNSYR